MDEINAGDIVAVQSGASGRKEGIVVGSYTDHLGRQILEVQLDGPGDPYYHAWYPTVTRVRRTISYTRPKHRTIERRIYW